MLKDINITRMSSLKSGNLDAERFARIRRTRHIRRAHVRSHNLENEALEK